MPPRTRGQASPPPHPRSNRLHARLNATITGPSCRVTAGSDAALKRRRIGMSHQQLLYRRAGGSPSTNAEACVCGVGPQGRLKPHTHLQRHVSSRLGAHPPPGSPFQSPIICFLQIVVLLQENGAMQMAATRVAFVASRQDGGGGGCRKPTWKWSLSPLASFASQ